jgi:hypothetical protein
MFKSNGARGKLLDFHTLKTVLSLLLMVEEFSSIEEIFDEFSSIEENSST